MTIDVKVQIKVTDETIDDIMVTALEGGICYWCHRAEVVGEYLGTYASEQISRGGKLRLWTDDGEKLILSKSNFLKGLEKYVASHPRIVCNGSIDAAQIDAGAADVIVQYAVFGKLVYG